MTVMRLIEGADNPGHAGLLNDMFRLRHDVFIKEMGWKLRTENGLERDQYDNSHTLYLVESDDSGEVIACVRMNSAAFPTMLSEVFPEMCEGGAPNSATTWELTRGAIARSVRKSKHFGAIECATIEAALLFGVTKACGLFSVDLLGKKMRTGLDATPLGLPRMIDGEPHVAAEFPMDRETLLKTGALYRISGPAIGSIHLLRQERQAA
jgi:acyl-homoserine lactone synthase